MLKKKNHSYFEMYFSCIIYDEARWLFCVSFDEGLRWGEISSFKYQLYPSLSCSKRKNYISDLEKAVEMHRNACACQKQTQKYQLELRMLIWAISWLFRNSFRNCLCESTGFKIERNSHWRCSIKNCFLRNYVKLTEKYLCHVLNAQLY